MKNEKVQKTFKEVEENKMEKSHFNDVLELSLDMHSIIMTIHNIIESQENLDNIDDEKREKNIESEKNQLKKLNKIINNGNDTQLIASFKKYLNLRENSITELLKYEKLDDNLRNLSKNKITNALKKFKKINKEIETKIILSKK